MYALIPDAGALDRYGARFRALVTDFIEEQSTPYVIIDLQRSFCA